MKILCSYLRLLLLTLPESAIKYLLDSVALLPRCDALSTTLCKKSQAKIHETS